jgi:hypothetical protein
MSSRLWVKQDLEYEFQNRPIRTLYLLDIAFRLGVFREWVFKSLMTTRHELCDSFCFITVKTLGRRGRDRMVVGFTTTCGISACHHYSCEFEPCSWRGVLNTTLCDIVCQWLATGRWFSPGTPVSSTNKTDCQDIAEILMKVALNTINQ